MRNGARHAHCAGRLDRQRSLRGSLVKKGRTTEALARVDTVVFEKTGTPTSGESRLVKVISLSGLPDAELLCLCAAAEKFNEHPVGCAVVRAAVGHELAVPNPRRFKALPG